MKRHTKMAFAGMKVFLALSLLLTLVSCAATPPPKTYDLGISNPPFRQKEAGIPLILLETPSLPHQLDRPEIVTRKGPFELLIHEQHRWAAPVERLIRDNLATRMDARLYQFRVIPGELASAYPPPDIRIQIQILEFSGDETGEVRLSGIFSLIGSDKKAKEEPFDIRVFTDSNAPELLAASQSLALDGLAEQLIEKITWENKNGSFEEALNP